MPPRSSALAVRSGSDGAGNGAASVSGGDQQRRVVPKRDMTDANFPTDAEGRTYHIGVKRGEVANRVLSVGPERRALLLAEYLEPASPGGDLLMLESSRGFVTITGSYQGAPVSIISTHSELPLLPCGAACVADNPPTGCAAGAGPPVFVLCVLCLSRHPSPWLAVAPARRPHRAPPTTHMQWGFQTPIS